jgi:hypothetical protein
MPNYVTNEMTVDADKNERLRIPGSGFHICFWTILKVGGNFEMKGGGPIERNDSSTVVFRSIFRDIGSKMAIR